MSHGGVSGQLLQPQGRKRGKKETDTKSLGQEIRVETVPTLCQGSEASASCGDGVVGGGDIRPQSNSHGPSWTKQAPCPQTSHILVASCSSSQDIGGTFPTPPFPQGCQGCLWDLNSAPERRTPRRGWYWGHCGSGIGWLQALSSVFFWTSRS